MRVDAIGDHICCFVPGGRSLVTVGMPGVTNTSQFKSRSSLMFALLHAVCSLLPLFPRDPLPDIGWAMEECSSFLLTRAQEAHHLDIHQCHLVQVQHRPGSVTLHVCLQYFKMLRVQVADQPERRVVSVSMPFNLACHLVSFMSSALSTTVDNKSQSKNYTTHKLLMYLRLD